MTNELFHLTGKRALVIGGATGMGAAVAQLSAKLGAEVVVLDVAEVSYGVAGSELVDLRDKASVDRCLHAVLPDSPFI